MVEQKDRFGELIGDALRDEAARCHLPSDFTKRLLHGRARCPQRAAEGLPRWLKVAAAIVAMASFVSLAAVVGRVILNAPEQEAPSTVPSDPETEIISITGCGVFLLLLGVEFFAWLRNPFDPVPAWVVYIFELIMILIGCVVYAYLRYRYDTGRFSAAIPVRYVGMIDKDQGWVLIVENTPVLDINRIVSICFQSKDSDIEEIIALGYVETKNDLGNFQIKVLKKYCRVGCDLQKLGYKLLTVKPVVDKDWLS